MKLAILGASGQIGRSLVDCFCKVYHIRLYLFGRKKETLVELFKEYEQERESAELLSYHTYQEFPNFEYDGILNCVGVGHPRNLLLRPYDIFQLTEVYDNLVLDYLKTKQRKAQYIYFSSGAVYGGEFAHPVEYDSKSSLSINRLNNKEFYGIAKLYAEAKHRSHGHLGIVDLRVFGYFSRFTPLDYPYLVADMVRAVKEGQIFRTTLGDIQRDYISPNDLSDLVIRICKDGARNTSMDVYSARPISKMELIEIFSREYNMAYSIEDNLTMGSGTGEKRYYYSVCENSRSIGRELGFSPADTSRDTIQREVCRIFEGVK